MLKDINAQSQQQNNKNIMYWLYHGDKDTSSVINFPFMESISCRHGCDTMPLYTTS